MPETMKILAISGSLRAASSNTAVLRAAALLAPEDVEVALYAGLADLPHFNPDLDDLDHGIAPPPVLDLRARIQAAGGLLISSPEYAHGVPGSLKNALDWLVGSPEIVGKPIALLNASPRATIAQASLVEILTTMSTRLIPEASIALPLLGRRLDAAAIAADPELAAPLRAAVAAFARVL